MSIKQVLMESRQTLKKMHGVDLTSMIDFKNMVVDDDQFETYKASLLESIGSTHKNDLGFMMDRTRMKLLESINSTLQLTPYETLALPILMAFYPRLIVKELVTVRPINAPDTLMPFMKFNFVSATGTVLGEAPMYTPVSYGPAVTETSNKFVGLGATDVLAANSLTADGSGIERTFKFWKFTATDGTTTETVTGEVQPTVDGNFHAKLVFTTLGTVYASGKVDYDTGIVTLMSTGGTGVTGVSGYYTCTFSLEQNTMNAGIKPSIDKIRLITEDQQISADWTIQLEQDYNALFDLDIQAQVLDILGKQMALDVDNHVLADIIKGIPTAATHTDTFDITPPSGYTLGPIYWYQNILQKLTQLSARIYTDTNIGEGNVLACNPVDASIFESLNKFSFDGKGADGGAMGYTSGSLAQRWKVFSSPIVTQGKMVLMHKPTEALSSIYVFAPYQPAIMSPYPLGATPSLTIISRNAKKFYRPLGTALLNIVKS